MHVIRNGHANGLQRYRCRECCKTFSALTGTPLNRLHKRGKWLDQAHALQDGQTLREIARALRIHLSTPLAALLSGGTQDRPAAGTDWPAEVDETMFLLSVQG
jgi:transposase-like protein